MGNSFCTKIGDTDDYGSKMNKIPPPAAGSYDQRQEERNAAVISAGIQQLKANSTHENANPHHFFSGDKFDTMSLHDRLHFFPAQNETVLFSAKVTKTNKRGKKQQRVWCLTDQAFVSTNVVTTLCIFICFFVQYNKSFEPDSPPAFFFLSFFSSSTIFSRMTIILAKEESVCIKLVKF